MKTKQTISKILIILVIVISAYVILAKVFSFFPFESKTTHNTQTPASSDNNTKQSSEKAPTTPNSSDSTAHKATDQSKTPIQNEGQDPNQANDITGYISNKTVNTQSKKLTIRVTINQFLHTTGKCTLTLTNGSKTLTYTAPTADNPSSATCQGFDVSLEQLSAGKWSIKIKVEADNKTGIINGSEVEI